MNDTHNEKTDSEQDTRESRPSHYVGIGASAGGLDSIGKFFGAMPPNSGVSFIVVQHLSPDSKGLMGELLSQKTEMKVRFAEHGMRVEPDHVYLIPPRKNLILFHGKLLLKEQEAGRKLNLPIDLFFYSLAEDQGSRAVAIILSGTGSDGARGVCAIRERSGMVMAQIEDSARYDGMPKAAISTGLVDFVLPPEQMPRELLAFVRHPDPSSKKRADDISADKDNMGRIFAELRQRTKVDFTFYKPSTIIRRIERRMTVCRTRNFDEYVHHLTSHPGEAMTLYRELLIGVTNFFRDPEVMEVLRQEYLPRLLRQDPEKALRFWVAGCATGEEAYTLAMLAQETMERLDIHRDVKIFATDIDKEALVFAGNGAYPEHIAAALGPKLLGKYFYRVGERYQIDRSLRSMVVFARHNLINDPPFTKIDLVSCRNLLIYLQPVLQQRALQMFNFSLSARGILLLGNSETVGELIDCYRPLHPKFKIYETTGKPAPMTHHAVSVSSDIHQYAMTPSANLRLPQKSEEVGLVRRFLDVVADRAGYVALLINEQMEVLLTIGDTTDLLKAPSERAGCDIFKASFESLSMPLSNGIQKVFRTRHPVAYNDIGLATDETGTLNLEISLLPEKGGQRFLAVALIEIAQKENTEADDHAEIPDGADAQRRIRDLELKLRVTQENLQATIEELETSNEALQAANEELLASNEELQSTNEALQSTNEELYTVNTEFQNKIYELTEMTNDVDNLLTHSGVGALFLDEDLRIRKYSPEIKRIFVITEADVGRPFEHLANRLADFDPTPDIKQVRKSARPFEKEVSTQEGRIYSMRIIPYHIAPKTFSGVVLFFVDITGTKALEAGERQYRQLFETMSDGVVCQTETGEIILANPAAERILGVPPDQLKGRNSMDSGRRSTDRSGNILPSESHPSMVALKTGKPVMGFTMGVYNPKDEKTHWLIVNAIPQIRSGETKPYQVLTTFREMTGGR